MKRIVVKIGTSTLTHDTGKLNIKRIEELARVVSDLKNAGDEVLIVSSGAIGVGVSRLGLKGRPDDTAGKQAAAAVGQCELMYIYDKFFSEYSYPTAQVLLTRDVIDDEKRKNNVVNTLETLIAMGAVPIINENDTVSVDEILFGDNDTLSAMVACLVNADMLIILSDIDGLYDKNPTEDKDAKLVPVVNEITDDILCAVGGAGSTRGTGGMITKIHAVEIAWKQNIDVCIANGKNPEILYDIADGKSVGTLFRKK